jgi:hypothetical protein
MPNEDQYELFELSPDEFERLCVELLMATGSGLTLVQKNAPRWIDAVAVRKTPTGNRTVGIEVSHRTTLHPDGFRSFLQRVSENEESFDEYIFITSSPMEKIHREILIEESGRRHLSAEIRLYGREDVAALLQKNVNIAKKYFKSVRDRARRRTVIQLLSVVGFAISLIGLLISLHRLYRANTKPESQFVTQIKSVEESLTRLADLEESLKSLKGELQQKAEEAIRISKEYEEAKKLKALTTEQLALVGTAIRTHERKDVLLNYFWGFLLGIASSVLATIVTDRWKHKQALSKPYS